MDELIEIKDRAWEKFCKLPGVHAVGIGKKVKGGVRTDEIVLTVFVTKKRPLDQLNPDAVVPPVFEGVKTDIIARPIPRTQHAAPIPSPITVEAAAIANGMQFKFASTQPVPAFGSVIVLTMTVHEGANRSVYTLFVGSDGRSTLANILGMLDQSLAIAHRSILVGVSNVSDFSVTVKNPATHSLAASCYVLPIDLREYRQDFLRGGMLIQAGASLEAGTLGCIATTEPTDSNPVAGIVGITCAHVVRDPRSRRQSLEATATATQSIELRAMRDAVGNPLPVAAHDVIFVALLRGTITVVGTAFYTTKKDEPLASIASGLAKVINDRAIPGVTAVPTSVAADFAKIDIGGFSAPNESIACLAEGPEELPIGAILRVRVENPSPREWVLEFGGDVPWGSQSVYVDINNSGLSATFGVFKIPKAGQRVEDVVQDLSTAINTIPSPFAGRVSAMAIGRKLKISDADLVNVWVQPDVRVGQPFAFFGAPTPLCCNQQAGRVIASRHDLDVALVQLGAGSKYKFHIEGLDAVIGTQAPSLDLDVRKRGAITGLTHGRITALHASGFIRGMKFNRVYRNVAVISSTTQEPDGKTWRAFSLAGDSGSAVVTEDSDPPKVVGVMFGGGDDAGALMTPIDDVIGAFSDLGLTLIPAPEVDVNAVHTVPASASVPHAFDAFAAQPLAAFGQRMQEAESEIAATPVGREYTEFVRRNLPEALDLVNRNRRVATVWHRSGGPELLNAVLRALRFDDEALPREINGRPLGDCISRLKKILLRYGSPGFASDIVRMAARYNDFAGMTYRQLLEAMRSGIPG